MDLNVVIALLVAWTAFNFVLKFANKNKSDYSFIVTFAYVIGFFYFYFSNLMGNIYYTYYTYSLVGFMVLILMFKIVISVFRKDITAADFTRLKNDIEDLNNESDLLRKRFISTIEILNDGMCFKDEGEDYFGTDKFIEFFGLKTNIFTEEMFNKMIYKDDLHQYKNKLEKLTKKHSIYTTTYRVQNNDKIIWIKEVGRKIFLDKKTSIISIIKPMDIRQFPESEIDVLNQLPLHKKMYEEIQNLVRTKKHFVLLKIHLSNVPIINEKYGRDVGDLMMGEY
ncbi:MAG: PAS domain-containing protein, partial [Candidatus Izimaplasma sp.]|nr:PAS domain-containing protein [Candidatus Izimaplasma bacterium]